MHDFYMQQPPQNSFIMFSNLSYTNFSWYTKGHEINVRSIAMLLLIRIGIPTKVSIQKAMKSMYVVFVI
jgi:hypothetical protein